MPEMTLDELLGDDPDKLPADAAEQVELALYRKAKGGLVTFREQLDRNGEPVKVRYEHPPDPVAAAKFLAATMPDRYGQQAMPTVVNNSLTVVNDPRVLARVSELLGITFASQPAIIDSEK